MCYPSAKLQGKIQQKEGVLGESQGPFEWISLTLCQFNLQTAYIPLPREFFQISHPIPRLEKEEQKKRRGRKKKEEERQGNLVLRVEKRESNSELLAEEKHLKTCYSYKTTHSEYRRKLCMTSPSDVPPVTPCSLKLCGTAVSFEMTQT